MNDFKSAYLRLQQIAALFKSGEILDVNEMITLQEESKQLYEYLQTQLKS